MRDYLFTISISTQAYSSKPNKYDCTTMKFRERTLSVDEFAENIRRGYSYCALFTHDGTVFTTTQKTDDNFKQSYTLSVDCDTMSVPMDEYLSTLPIQPSIAYTTTSNGLEGKGFRYRLIYILDDALTTKNEVKSKYYGLLSMLGIQYKGTNDNCGSKCSQYFNGSLDCEIRTTDTLLHTDDIPAVCVEDEPCEKKPTLKTEPHAAGRISDLFTGDFKSDWYKLPLNEILLKYAPQYTLWKRSPNCEYDDNGIYYYQPTDGMIVLPKYKDKDGKCKDLVKKGWRTSKSFIYATQIRLLNPEITFNGLCYALGELIAMKFQLDSQITNQWIAQQAAAAWAIPYEALKSSVKSKFTTSVEYAIANGISRQQVAQDERRRVKDKAVSRYFNALKTDRENVKVLKEHGVSVSPKFLKEYRERYGLTKSAMQIERFQELVELGMSMNEIMNELGISRATYFNMKKESKK